jgi:hypothetical protein
MKLEPLAKQSLKKWSKLPYKKAANLAAKVGLFWIDEKGFLHFGKRKDQSK